MCDHHPHHHHHYHHDPCGCACVAGTTIEAETPQSEVIRTDPGRRVKSIHDVLTADGRLIITITYCHDVV